jgi:hypothetical protein
MELIHTTREGWLLDAKKLMAPQFESIGLMLPSNLRVCIGFPSSGRRGNRLGECWMPSHSRDGTIEIFIRIDADDGLRVLDIFTHELLHAALPPRTGHGKEFRKYGLLLGMEKGPMRHALPGAALREKLAAIAAQLGALPHAPLDFRRHANGNGEDEDGPDTPKKQKTRLLKALCAKGHDYSCRITAKWVHEVGAPLCPQHGEMTVEGLDGEDDEQQGRGEDEHESPAPQLNAMKKDLTK